MRKSWYYLSGIVIMLICVLLINVFSIPMHDELSYAFGGQSTPLTGACSRVQSFMDIVRQQWADYHANGNGRVFIHGLAAFFGGFRLYYFFDVLNTIVWVGFVWLLMKEGRIVLTIKSYFACLCFAFWFLWYAESCSMNAVFAIDYLWCPALTIVMMMAWRKWSSRLWFLPLCFIFGWTQDASVLPFICAIAGSVTIRAIVQKRISLPIAKIANFTAVVGGCAFLCLSPASLSRAGSTVGGGIAGTLKAALGMVPGFLLYGAPLLFLVLLFFVVIKNHKRLFQFIFEDIDWWIYFVAGFGLYILCAPIAGNRLMMPWLMAGTIIIFRHIECLQVNKIISGGLCCFVLSWMVMVTWYQVLVGIDNRRMLTSYRDDAQGITWRTPVYVPGYAIARGLFNKWHLSLFAREFEKDVPPIFFTKRMYDDIYKDPHAFLSDARKLNGASEVVVNDACGYVALKKGASKFTAEEMRCADVYIREHAARRPKWAPGRLARMFPTEQDMLDPKLREFTFVAKDGNRYVVYCGGEYEPQRIDGDK